MADPTQNTGGASNPQSGREAAEALREALKIGGDYAQQLKANILDLERTAKLYDNINAKLATLEKSSINIKEINKEVLKVAQKQFISQQKVNDLEKEFNKTLDGRKDAVDDYVKQLDEINRTQGQLAKAAASGNKDDVDALLFEIALQKEQAQNSLNLLDIEQLSYIAAQKELELNNKITERLKQELKIEKEINNQIGLTGAGLKLFADKLGIGDRYYEQMVTKAKNLKALNKELTFGDKLKVLGSAAKGALGEIASDPIAMLGAAIPLVGGLISGVLSGIKTAFDFMLGIQDKTVKFGRALGVSTEQATLLKKQFGIINLTNGDLLVNTDKLIDSQTELVGLLGTTNVLTSEQLATNIKLKDLLGLDAQARASIAQSSVITGKSSQEITESVLAQVEGLKAATGIGLDYRQVLDQASKLGGALGLQFAQYPGKIAKALVVTKSFGLELKQLDGIADSFLDFESSISKEFEAQVLLGRQINLTKARQAFLDNDLATAAAEISKNAGDYLEFSKLNRIQQEAIAGAVGMNRDQLGDMLKNQLYLNKLGAKETASSTEKLKLAKERFGTEKEINKQLGEGAYQNMVTMSATEKIAAFIDKIRVAIGDFLTKSGIVDKLTQLFDYFSSPDKIREAMLMVKDFTVALIHMVGVLAKGVASVARTFYAISHDDKEAVGRFFDEAEANVGLMGTGGMSDTATLNTGTVASQRVPAFGNTSTTTANKQASGPATPNSYNFYLDGQPIFATVKEKFELDHGMTKK